MFSSQQRKIILERDGYLCQKCKLIKDSDLDLHVHHIKPLYKDGDDDFYNLITLHKKCHQKDHKYLENDEFILNKFKEHAKQFEKPKNWDLLGGSNRDSMVPIRIIKETKQKIEVLAKSKGLAQVTVLEYLLNGKIKLDEL